MLNFNFLYFFKILSLVGQCLVSNSPELLPYTKKVKHRYLHTSVMSTASFLSPNYYFIQNKPRTPLC